MSEEKRNISEKEWSALVLFASLTKSSDAIGYFTYCIQADDGAVVISEAKFLGFDSHSKAVFSLDHIIATMNNETLIENMRNAGLEDIMNLGERHEIWNEASVSLNKDELFGQSRMGGIGLSIVIRLLNVDSIFIDFVHHHQQRCVVLINLKSGRALDVFESNKNNGATIGIWQIHDGANQEWIIHEDGSIVNPFSGKALDVSGGWSNIGTKIHLWEKNGTGAQKWEKNSDGTIINPQSGMALDVRWGRTEDGTKVHLWPRNGTGAQQWRAYFNVCKGRSEIGREVIIINPQSGKVLDMLEGQIVENGATIGLCEIKGDMNQTWMILGDGTILHEKSGKALDVRWGEIENGTKVHLWERNGTGAQKWDLKADGRIVNVQSGKALNVCGGGQENGSMVEIRSCESGVESSQKWKLLECADVGDCLL